MEEIRGSTLIDGYRIEYFEKTLKSMYEKAINEFKNQSNAVVSMIVYGTVILDRNGKIAELSNYIQQIHSLPMPCLSEEVAKEQLAIINNFIDDLKYLIDNNNLYVNHVYHLTLERIKDFYCSYNGLPGISRTKFLKVITDDNYRDAIKKEAPSLEFTKLYIECLDDNKPFNERLNSLFKLFEYSTKAINFDKNEHRIILNKIKR